MTASKNAADVARLSRSPRKEDADGVLAILRIGNENIGASVAIDVGDLDGCKVASGAEGDRGLKGAVTVPQERSGDDALAVDEDQVEAAVGIEIGELSLTVQIDAAAAGGPAAGANL